MEQRCLWSGTRIRDLLIDSLKRPVRFGTMDELHRRDGRTTSSIVPNLGGWHHNLRKPVKLEVMVPVPPWKLKVRKKPVGERN